MSPLLLPTFCDADQLGRFSSHIPDACLCNQNGVLLDFAIVVSRAATNGVQAGEQTELRMGFPSQNSTYSLWQVAMGSDRFEDHHENISVW